MATRIKLIDTALAPTLAGATFTGHLDLGDNDKIRFGDSDDYQIHHNANGVTYLAGSVVEHNSSTWRIKNLAGTETLLNASADNAVDLYYNGSKKLETTITGVTVTGELESTTLDVNGAGDISGNLAVGGNLTLTGNLTVNGTTTTLSTATLDVEDKNITLNKGSGDTSASADGAGITIQDAVDASNDASLLWNAASDQFVFSHKLVAPRFIQSQNIENTFYSAAFSRSGSGTAADIYGANGTFALGTDASNTKLVLASTGVTVTGTAFVTDGIQDTGQAGSATVFNQSGSTADFRVESTGNTHMLFVDGGLNRVGIGTDSPGTDLQIGDGTGSPFITIDKSTTGTSGILLKNAGSNKVKLLSNASEEFELHVNNALAMYVKENGNVGIGETNPQAKLCVGDGYAGNTSVANFAHATDAYIEIENMTTQNGAGVIFTNVGTKKWTIQKDTSAHGLYIQDASTNPNMSFLQGGKVGVGTTNPQYKFDVVGTDDITMRIHRPSSALGLNDTCGIGFSQRGDGNTSSSDTRAAIVSTYNGSLHLITEPGGNLNSNPVDHAALSIVGTNQNVGIGTSDPDSKLEIFNNSITGNTQIHVHNDKAGDAAVIRLEGKRSSINDTGQILFANNGNNVARIDARSAADDGEIRFFTSATGTGNTLDQKMTVLSTPFARAEVHTRGAHSVGDGNTGAVNDPGCRVLGWYNANCHGLSANYLHLVTTLWGGGSPAGNSEYIMGGFRITGHSYSTNASYGEAGIFFHNWSGSVNSGYSANYTGSFTNFAHVYVNSSGYVTLRLAATSYRHYWVDLFQAGFYPMRNIKVSAATASSSATI